MQVSGCVYAAVNFHAFVRVCVDMVSLTTDGMPAESSGGEAGSPTPRNLAGIQQVACIFCNVPLLHPTVLLMSRFAINCLCPLSQVVP